MITIDVNDLKTALVFVLLVAAIVLVGYLIVVVKNLVTTMKELNKILEDASVISSIAAERAVEVNEMIDDVHSTVSELSHAVKGETGTIGAVANVTKAVTSLAALFRGGKDKTEKKVKRKNINKC